MLKELLDCVKARRRLFPKVTDNVISASDTIDLKTRVIYKDPIIDFHRLSSMAQSEYITSCSFSLE